MTTYTPTALETPAFPDWLDDATPGLADAAHALNEARDARDAITPPKGKTLGEVGIRVDALSWKPAPRVNVAEFDEVRVAWETFAHDRHLAERALERAVDVFEGLLYGDALDAEALGVRADAASARVEAIDHALEHDPLTGGQRRALESERVFAARYSLTTSPSALKAVAHGGTATVMSDGGRVAVELGPDYSRASKPGRVMTAYGIIDV